jgi:hypothetical protein
MVDGVGGDVAMLLTNGTLGGRCRGFGTGTRLVLFICNGRSRRRSGECAEGTEMRLFQLWTEGKAVRLALSASGVDGIDKVGPDLMCNNVLLVSFHDMTKTALAGELICRLFIYRVVCLDAALIRLWRVKLSNVEAV